MWVSCVSVRMCQAWVSFPASSDWLSSSCFSHTTFSHLLQYLTFVIAILHLTISSVTVSPKSMPMYQIDAHVSGRCINLYSFSSPTNPSTCLSHPVPCNSIMVQLWLPVVGSCPFPVLRAEVKWSWAGLGFAPPYSSTATPSCLWRPTKPAWDWSAVPGEPLHPPAPAAWTSTPAPPLPAPAPPPSARSAKPHRCRLAGPWPSDDDTTQRILSEGGGWVLVELYRNTSPFNQSHLSLPPFVAFALSPGVFRSQKIHRLKEEEESEEEWRGGENRRTGRFKPKKWSIYTVGEVALWNVLSAVNANIHLLLSLEKNKWAEKKRMTKRAGMTTELRLCVRDGWQGQERKERLSTSFSGWMERKPNKKKT